MTLNAFALEIMESAKRQLRDDGSVLATVFIDGPKPFILGLEGLPRTPEERRAFFFELGQKMARGQPTQVLMVFDGWMKETDEEFLEGSLADDPEAVDSVVVATLDRQGRAHTIYCHYERVPRLSGLEIRFGPVETADRGRNYLLTALFMGVDSASD